VRNMAHWAQLVRQRSPRFCRFDFGGACAGHLGMPRPCNLAAYGAAEPPLYDLGAIRTPLALLSGAPARPATGWWQTGPSCAHVSPGRMGGAGVQQSCSVHGCTQVSW